MVWIALQAASPGSDPASAAPFESALHRRLYRHRADVAAIVQSRPTFCTALACVARVQEAGIPAFHPDLVVAAGGALRCAAGPATAAPDAGGQSDPGTDAAGFELIALALADRNACLLASRGLLTAGATLQLAMQRAEEIEALAQIYLRVLLLNGARG